MRRNILRWYISLVFLASSISLVAQETSFLPEAPSSVIIARQLQELAIDLPKNLSSEIMPGENPQPQLHDITNISQTIYDPANYGDFDTISGSVARSSSHYALDRMGATGSFENLTSLLRYAPPILSSDSDAAASHVVVLPVVSPQEDTKIHWKAANQEALLSTGIMHTFNLWTEAGTRDALNGPWLDDYLRSVSELRGWSDSDTFMSPYIGHSIQGSSYGFTLRQNDPKYRTVQLGDGRDYYISLLRSMGFSAVWHTQWKIGPISEASIGNVMLHASPGFITLVDTPTLGTIAMIGEDAADRYLIIGLENRTSSRILIMLARSFLNPGRSFANMMAFKVPWNRDTRYGIMGDNYLIRKQLVADYKNGSGEKPFEFVQRPPVTSNDDTETDLDADTYPKAAPIELGAYPNYERLSGDRNCIGGGGSGAARINDGLQIVSEVNGCLIMGMPAYNDSADSLFYGSGLRWGPLASHRVSPFAEALFGGRKVTYEVDNPALREQLLDEWNNGDGTLPHYPMRSAWSTEVAANGPSLAVGGGLDVVVKRPFTFRVIDVEYTHSWMPDVEMIHPQSGFRITTEAVLRIGTW